MNILLIQLSDMHCQVTDQELTKKLDKAVDVLSTFTPVDHAMLIFSGDLTDTASKKEYQIGSFMIGRFLKNLGERLNCGFINTLIVPGNHDMVLPEDSRKACDIEQWDKNGHLDEELQRLSLFFKYAQSKNCFKSDRIVDIRTISLGKFKIQVSLINSAPYSTREKEDKQLHYLPSYVGEKISQPSSKDTLNISVCHHSYEFDGMTHDYTHKGGVVHTEILLPDHAPAAFSDRAVLWNEVEKIEKAKNAQLAREIEVSLPRELTREQSISLVREYVKRHFVAAGMCADVCLHDTGGGNPHAHIMLTMRPFDERGEWGAKQRKEYILDRDGNKIYDPKKRQYKCKSIPATDWNEQTKAEEWRAAWAGLCNQALEQNGHAERIDYRSYKRQGIDQIPTVHLGVAASAMEKRGIRTERGDLNREIEVTNQKLRQLKARISKLQDWLKEEQENTEPPTLADYIQGILSRKAQAEKAGYSQSLYNLKDVAKMLNFLQANSIMDMAGLDEKFKSMIGEQLDIQGKLKPVERRLATLKKHIEQADIYFKYKGKKPLTEAEQILFTTAKDYLKGVMNGKTTIPTKTWKEEYTKLTAERKTLNQRYLALKEEVKEAEKIRKSVYSILRQEQREQQPSRKQDMER